MLKYRKFATNEQDLLIEGKIAYINMYNYFFVRKYLNSFDVLYFDGIGLLLIYKMCGGRSKRMSPDNTSLFPVFISYFDSFLVIGGREEENIYFAERCLKGKTILWRQNGYNQILLDDIDKSCGSNPKGFKLAVIVGLGSPKQEEVISQLSPVENTTYISVGAYISQFYKNPNYFPKWVNRYHLRMPYRMFREKLYGRLLFYPVGVFYFLVDLLSGRFK